MLKKWSRIVAIVAGGGVIIDFLTQFYLDARYLAFRSPDPDVGRTSPYVVKGVTVYLSVLQARDLRLLEVGGLVLFTIGLIAATVYNREAKKTS